MDWEETLKDNLLNFAATPRGLLLLQQTGMLGECVAYMYSRYARKLQVTLIHMSPPSTNCYIDLIYQKTNGLIGCFKCPTHITG